MKYYLSIFLSNLTCLGLVASHTTRLEHPSNCMNLMIVCSKEAKLYSILEKAFPHVATEKIQIENLQGGFSDRSLYKVQVQDHPYVLRVHPSGVINLQEEREYFAMLEASKRNIAPPIVYYSPDKQAMLMEFIEAKTLTIDQARSSDNCIKIANAIRQAHQITGYSQEGETLQSKARRCHRVISQDKIGLQEEIDKAFELVETYLKELNKYEYTKVNVHGDLNPRNIFLVEDKVYFIDWAETSLQDPFYDLSYFAQKLNYDEENEVLLLKTYLERSPTVEEWNRYQLNKKLHQAFWVLTNLYLTGAELKKHPQQEIDKMAPLRSWESYQKIFAEVPEQVNAQYFYELSRLNYQIALQPL